ncbi:MAG: hypothetical protein HQK54_06655 [Oligoflexales bacterium]|nr:hypothetical protein [Oligoflexales bacterium]
MIKSNLSDEQKDESKVYEVGYQNLKMIYFWFFIIFLSLIVGAMSFLHHFIKEERRTWHFGVEADIPGESIYSISNLREKSSASLKQISPLPDSIPLLHETKGEKGNSDE